MYMTITVKDQAIDSAKYIVHVLTSNYRGKEVRQHGVPPSREARGPLRGRVPLFRRVAESQRPEDGS